MLAAYTIYTSFGMHKNEGRDTKVKTKLHTTSSTFWVACDTMFLEKQHFTAE